MKKVTLLASAFGGLMSFGVTSTYAQGAGPTAPASNDMVAIEEVVVTAQRFTETAQKTPIIITVLSDKQLAGVSDVRQLSTVTPGIQIASAGNLIQTYVRGVGSFNATSSQETAIAYNADGVFLFASTMPSPLLYDLERVEILKGPQGTLYGRNASGGAVNLITRDASLLGFGGYVEGSGGNYDARQIIGAVNIPLGEQLAVRLAAQHAEHSGYLTDGTDDQDLTSGRLRLRWEPSSNVTLRIGIDGSRAKGKGAGSSIAPNPTNDKWLGALDPRADTGPFFLGGYSLLSSPPNRPPYFNDEQWSVNAQLDANLGFATLTLLPAYRRENIDQLSYLPGYFYNEHAISRQKSFEARLSNRTDQLKWVAGAYYFKINQLSDLNVRNESNFQNVLAHIPTWVESYAFFGEATFSLTDTFRVIGGLRYTHEESNSSGASNALLGPPGAINPSTGLPNVQTAVFSPYDPFTNPTGELLDYPIAAHYEDSAWTWKAGLEFDLTPNSMVFATVSRGFKGGGSYVDLPSLDSTFRPEFLTAYELGSRNRFLNDSLQVNGELFYWKLKDQQVPFVGFNPIGQATFLTLNAGSATMYGANADVVWKASAHDTFTVSAEYLHSNYDSFRRVVPSAVILPGSTCNVTGYSGPTSFAPAILDCSGRPLLKAPKWSGSASYEHVFDLANGGNVTANVRGIFASSRFLDANYSPLLKQASSVQADASLTYNAPQDRYSMSVWVNNIGDTRVKNGGAQFYGFYSRPTLNPPRTYGVRVKVGF